MAFGRGRSGPRDISRGGGHLVLVRPVASPS